MGEVEDAQARRIREAFGARAAAELPELLEQAWIDARAEVGQILRAAAVDALLDLASAPPTTAPARPDASDASPAAAAAAHNDGSEVAADDASEGSAGVPADGQNGVGASRACYIYGITRAGTAVPAADGLGLTGTLRTIESGALAAVVSDVDPAAFSEQRWADRAAVEEDVRTHDQLLRALFERSPVVPLRFGTVVGGAGDVQRLLDTHHEALVDALRRFSGAAEWGVKATWPASDLHRWALQESEELRSLDAEASRADSGTSYLLGRRRDRAVERVAENLRDRVVADCHARLVEETEQAALFSPDRAGDGDGLVLNASYLVREDALESFEKRCDDLVQEYGPAGVAFEVVGPWPPYSFVADLFEGSAL